MSSFTRPLLIPCTAFTFGKAVRPGLRGMLCALLLAGTPALAAATTTALSITSGGSAVTTIASGGVVTLTASTSSGAGAVTTGQVNFCEAAATYCTDIQLLGTAQLTSAGTATLKFVPGIGSHSYKAVFLGTASNAASSSSASGLAVTGVYPTTTTIGQSGSAGNYTLTATVFGAGASGPTGTVSFLDTSNANHVLATAPLGSSTQTLSFLTAANSATGPGPSSVVVADFNGDGKLDIVTLNGASAPANPTTLTLLLGKGDGTFTAGPGPAVSFSPGSMAVGDFNGDGRADLAVASSASNAFTVLLGNGDGTFTTSSVSTAGPNSLLGPIFAGDFNGDGRLDLAVAGERRLAGEPYTVTVALGNGDGTFTQAASYVSINIPSLISVGDFNGDGRLDVVVIGISSSSGQLLLGNGDGTFTAASAFAITSPNVVAVGDFNGDGKLDMAVGTGGPTPALVTLAGVGDGTFAAGLVTSLPSGTVPGNLAIGDFNQDGKADIAIVSQQPGSVTVLQGKGDGTFTVAASPATGTSAQGLAAGDFNGDGLADLAVASPGNNSVSVLVAQSVQAVAVANNISPAGTGTHQVNASYPGDGSYSPSLSGTTGLTALSTTTLTLAATPASSTFGQQMVLTAMLSPFTAQGQSTDGESVTFFNGAVSAGTGKLAGGVATLNLTSLPAGTRSLRAVYGGDTNLAGSTSNTLSYTVLQAGTATTFALSNQNLTLTATVVPASGGVPTGMVGFYVGQTLIGSGPLMNGVASYTAGSFPAGDVAFSAQYSGDGNFAPSASPSVLVLALVPASTTLTVAQAGSVTDTVTLSTIAGYSGTVQMSCSNLPQAATCSFVPSVFLFQAGSNAGSASLRIQTGVGAQARVLPPARRDKSLTAFLAAALWVPGVFVTAASRRRRKANPRGFLRNMEKLLLLMLMGGMAASLTACGGSAPAASGSTGRTPAGAYTVQVVATGANGLSQTASVSVTVQ